MPVFWLARERLGANLGLAMSAAYVLSWGIQKAAAFDFHELAFAPLLIALALLGIETGRDRLFWPATLSLLLVKEELAGVVVFLGFLLALKGRVAKGLLVSLLGFCAFAAIIGWVMPAFRGSDSYSYAGTYGDLGAGPGAAFETILTQPLEVLGSLVSPPTKIRTFLMWVGPFLFLPLLSPLALPAIPLVLARFLSSSPQHWTTGFHYSAPLAPILAMSATDGLASVLRRIRDVPRRERIASGAVALMLLLCAILPGKLPVWRLLSPAYYRGAQDEAIARRALSLIPTTASVVAQDSLTPHLSQRQSIYTLRLGAPEAQFVLAGEALSPWPNESWLSVQSLLAERRAHDYRTLLDEGGFVVLAAPEPISNRGHQGKEKKKKRRLRARARQAPTRR